MGSRPDGNLFRTGTAGWMLAVLGIAALLFFGMGPSVEAQSGGASSGQYLDEEIEAAEGELEVRRDEVQRTVDRVAEVGGLIQESQSLVDGAVERSAELEGDAGKLRRQLDGLRAARDEARARHEERVVSAYRGEELRGLEFLLDGVLGGGGIEVYDPELRRIIFEGRDDLGEYEAAEQRLRDTIRQLEEKDRAYKEASGEENRRAGKLRDRENDLRAAVRDLRDEVAASELYVEGLEAEERARIAAQTPATGGAAGQRGYEMGVARSDIVAEEVGPIPRERYLKLYRKSAKQYGFADDWFILAAVGKVESDHGSNMGPSSAGAMGPMQFLPSTWADSGVDGNGDGEANIMDPEDAIPAAAKYLQTGGAPEDWYAALYSYNHADWYVRKVLAVSEGYRQIEQDGGDIR